MKKIIFLPPLVLSLYYFSIFIGHLVNIGTLLDILGSVYSRIVFVLTFTSCFYVLSQIFKKADFKVSYLIYTMIFCVLVSNAISKNPVTLIYSTILNSVALILQIILSIKIILTKNSIIKSLIELKLFAISFLTIIILNILNSLTAFGHISFEILNSLYFIPYSLLFFVFRKIPPRLKNMNTIIR